MNEGVRWDPMLLKVIFGPIKGMITCKKREFCKGVFRMFEGDQGYSDDPALFYSCFMVVWAFQGCSEEFPRIFWVWWGYLKDLENEYVKPLK